MKNFVIKPTIFLDFSDSYKKYEQLLNSQDVNALDVKAVQEMHEQISKNLHSCYEKLIFDVSTTYEIKNLAEYGFKLETAKANQLWSDLGLFTHTHQRVTDNNFQVALNQRRDINIFTLESLEKRIYELLNSKADDKEKRLLAVQLIYLNAVNNLLNNKQLNHDVLGLIAGTIQTQLERLYDDCFGKGLAQASSELKNDFETGIKEQSSGFFWAFKNSEYQQMLKRIEDKCKRVRMG